MGCDIHCYAEVLRGGNWYPLFPLRRIKEKDEPEYLEMDYIYRDRDYNVFTFLAGVRDYSKQITPLEKPRGLPDDLSDEIRKLSVQWSSDGHTHSWYTLKELSDALQGDVIFPMEVFCLDPDWKKLMESQPEMRLLEFKGQSQAILVPVDRTGIISSYWAEEDYLDGHGEQTRRRFGKIFDFRGLKDLVKTLSAIKQPPSTSRWQRMNLNGECEVFNTGFLTKDEVRIVFWFDN